MKDLSKRVLTGVFVIAAILFAGYVAYRLYNYMITDATQRIRRGVSEGVSEGVGKGFGESASPFGWPKKMFNK